MDNMASRREEARGPAETSSHRSWGILFWVLFVILIFGLFLINRNRIQETLDETQFMERLLGKPVTEIAASATSTGAGTGTAAPATGTTVAPPSGATGQDAGTVTVTPPAGEGTTGTVSSRETTAGTVILDEVPLDTTPPEGRTRPLYFIQVDPDGVILRVPVDRFFPPTDTPLADAIKALIAGPTTEERAGGLLSLIPGDTQVLSVTVRGSTAYVSFSEEFQFNRYGLEGYAAALREVVWTATEFPTIRNVQILIEGQRLDYLGEGIWIGSPLDRDLTP